EVPQLTLEKALRTGGTPHARTSWNFLRDMNREVCVAREQLQGSRAGGFGDELSAEVACPDRVRLVHRRSTSVLVAPDGKGQPEGEDETDDTEKRSLENAEGFSQLRLVLTQIAPECVTEACRATDDRENEERQRPTREGEEHDRRLAGGSAT